MIVSPCSWTNGSSVSWMKLRTVLKNAYQLPGPIGAEHFDQRALHIAGEELTQHSGYRLRKACNGFGQLLDVFLESLPT